MFNHCLSQLSVEMRLLLAAENVIQLVVFVSIEGYLTDVLFFQL